MSYHINNTWSSLRLRLVPVAPELDNPMCFDGFAKSFCGALPTRVWKLGLPGGGPTRWRNHQYWRCAVQASIFELGILSRSRGLDVVEQVASCNLKKHNWGRLSFKTVHVANACCRWRRCAFLNSPGYSNLTSSASHSDHGRDLPGLDMQSYRHMASGCSRHCGPGPILTIERIAIKQRWAKKSLEFSKLRIGGTEAK